MRFSTQLLSALALSSLEISATVLLQSRDAPSPIGSIDNAGGFTYDFTQWEFADEKSWLTNPEVGPCQIIYQTDEYLEGMTGQAGQIFPFCRYREGPQQVPMQNLGVNLYTFFRNANHFNVGKKHSDADNELGHGMGKSIYIFDDLEAIGGNFTKPKKCAFWSDEGRSACPNWNPAKTNVKFFDPKVFAVGDILPDMTRANLYKDGEPMKA